MEREETLNERNNAECNRIETFLLDNSNHMIRNEIVALFSGSYQTDLSLSSNNNNNNNVAIEKIKMNCNTYSINLFFSAVDFEGHSPLYYSIISNNLFLLNHVLLTYKLDVNFHDATNWTLIHYAAYLGNCDAVKLLLKFGASVLVEDSVGSTPLHMAAFQGNYEIVSLLLENGAPINLQCNLGWVRIA